MSNPLAAFLYVSGLVEEHADHSVILTRTQQVQECLMQLKHSLSQVDPDHTEHEVQSLYYEAGKLHFAQNLRYWFQVCYQVLLRQNDGPRLGQFTQLMTAQWVEHRIEQVLTDAWGLP